MISKLMIEWHEKNGSPKINLENIETMHEKIYEILLNNKNFIAKNKTYQFEKIVLKVFPGWCGVKKEITLLNTGELTAFFKTSRCKDNNYSNCMTTRLGKITLNRINQCINESRFFSVIQISGEILTDATSYKIFIRSECGIARPVRVPSLSYSGKTMPPMQRFLRLLINEVDIF
ncbi:hypothetical protein [Solidesulfovibrio magneticus]|nr:hypothetical protein [Solidesulfovibrio magneticus]